MDNKRSLYIHAGFPKCASSSIQQAIYKNLKLLNQKGIFPLGSDLKIASKENMGIPLWPIEKLKQQHNNEGAVLSILRECSKVSSDGDLVVTAENLSDVRAPNLFFEADKEYNVKIVFYLKPQFEYISSAWKQWALKNGLELTRFSNDCMRLGRPSYREILFAWKQSLPKATISVRPLVKNHLHGENPSSDFLVFLGCHLDATRISNKHFNTSWDYSILHVLMRGHDQFFSGIHDNEFTENLESALTEKAKKINIDLFNFDSKMKIENCFRKENKSIIKEFCTVDDVDTLYNSYFVPRETGKVSYLELEEKDIAARCIDILMTCPSTQEVELLKKVARFLMEK